MVLGIHSNGCRTMNCVECKTIGQNYRIRRVGQVFCSGTVKNMRSISEGQYLDSSPNGRTAVETVEPQPRQRWSTAYERLSYDLSSDERCLKEVTLGRRIGFYRIRGELGSGNFSQVRMGIHSLTKEKVAIKILDKTKLDQKTQRLLSREIASMERLHHENIIRLYEVVETLAKLHIVMEYAAGGELFTKISNEGRLPEDNVRVLFAQIVAAVDHMHQSDIIHRDLKAENVFLTSMLRVKIGDFGFSITSSIHEALHTFCGSPPYAAPELFRDEHYKGIYVDIWALGILLYFMLTGVMPFRAETVAKLKRHILDGAFTIPAYVSPGMQSLIRAILQPVPKNRISIADIKQCESMDGQHFPEPLDRYPLMPAIDERNLLPDEIEARHTMHDLGIDDDHMRMAHGKDSRSSITGTYRILLHRIQRRNTEDEELLNAEQEAAQTADNTAAKPTDALQTQETSRFCSIL